MRDPQGLVTGGYLLEAAADGSAVCTRTSRAADLTLSVADLATFYLGDESPVRLAALGRLRKERPGAAGLADLLFRTPRRPWCPDEF